MRRINGAARRDILASMAERMWRAFYPRTPWTKCAQQEYYIRLADAMMTSVEMEYQMHDVTAQKEKV